MGILDADIYGPSQPKMFGVEGYVPEAVSEEGADRIVLAESMDIRLMSIGFFIKPTDALLWRGAMAVSALKQMIHQTRWGTLDFLLADLPPGTGDVHLSIIGELKIDAAVIVSTPQQIAVADVVRGVEMFRNETSTSPWRASSRTWRGSPRRAARNRYYIFGRGGARAFAERAEWISWAKSPSCSRSWKEGGGTPCGRHRPPRRRVLPGNRRKGGFKSDENG